MINFIFLIRACEAIEPCLFVAYFLIVFPTADSCVESNLDIHIFIHNMDSISTIRRKEIWRIRRGGQSTNRIFRGKIDGIWEQSRGISVSFMRTGSIINGNGRYIQI